MSTDISVIIPALNEEKYIKRTLLALKNQDYGKKFEIIVADNGSTDDTFKIAKKFADKVVRVKERGVGRARNVGAEAAKGRFLIFLDSDTVALPNLISEFMNSFASKQVVTVTCPVFPIEATPKNMLLYSLYNINAILTIKAKQPKIAGICVAYRQAQFLEVGGFNEDTHAFEDFMLSKNISKFGRTVMNQNTVVFTSTRRLKRWGSLTTAKRYVKLYLQHLLNKTRFASSDYEVIR